MDILEKIKNLEEFIALAKPATKDQIKKAEKILGVEFNEEYKRILLEFGSFCGGGMELLGLGGDYLGNEILEDGIVSVVKETLHARELFPEIPEGFYAIENPGIDNIFALQNKEGKIGLISSKHSLEMRYENLDEYISSLDY